MPVEKTRNHGRMSEAAFFGWIRSALRRLSIRWAPRSEYLKANRRQILDLSRRAPTRNRWEYQCELCSKWHYRKEVECDHIIECGSLKKFNDLPGFCERLFVEIDGWRILCKGCHQVKTNEARHEKISS